VDGRKLRFAMLFFEPTRAIRVVDWLTDAGSQASADATIPWRHNLAQGAAEKDATVEKSSADEVPVILHAHYPNTFC
jgi:hypothetical protein